MLNVTQKNQPLLKFTGKSGCLNAILTKQQVLGLNPATML